MKPSSVLRRISLVALFAWLALPLAASSDDVLPFSDLEIAEPQRDFSDTQECVQPEEEMRRNHMKYILHQRDQTMHQGIRTRTYSLEECINCHASKDEATGEWIRVEDKRHFCATCHTYAAVHIDCFQCHADVPVRAPMLTGSRAAPARDDLSAWHSTATLQLLAAEGKLQ